jgi:hypothetical protein
MVADCLHLDSQQLEHLTRLPVGHALVKLQDRYFSPFLVRFPLMQIKKGIVTDSMIQHTPDFDDVEEAIQPEPAKPELTPEEKSFLKDIVVHRFSPVAQRYVRLGLSARKGNKLQSRLTEKGLVVPEFVHDGRGRRKLLGLTDKARQLLGLPEEGRRSGGIEHQFWVERVAEHLAAAGFQIEREFPIGEGKTVDLVATRDGKRIAVEVETGKSDAIGNISKCLEAGYESVLCLPIGKESTDRIREQAKNSGLHPSKVKILEVSESVEGKDNLLEALEAD